MTTRLYYTAPDCLAFDATVVSTEDGGRRVVLDRTAFYPTSGGQPHDTGTLGGADVVDVVDEECRIVHLLAHPLACEVGSPVRGVVDAARRRDHMQQHTGQHLLSAVFAEHVGAGTVSVHFGASTSLIELETPDLSPAQLEHAERRANEIVGEARPVTVSFEEAAAAVGLRKPSDRAGTLRVVTIADLDRSACGGTHVTTTAAIGPILLGRTERIRQRVRVEFVCGGRAIARARGDHEALARTAQLLSAAPADLPTLVAAQIARLRAAESERASLSRQLAEERARRLHSEAAPDAAGRRLIVEHGRAGGTEMLRLIAEALSGMPGAVFVAGVDDPPTIFLAAAEDSGVHAGTRLRDAVAAEGGRGGGSPRVARGSVPDAPAVARVVAALAASRG